MESDRCLSWPASVALGLSLSFASSLGALGWLASAGPTSLGARLADETVRLIGHSASHWFLAYSAALAVPIFAGITTLRWSRLRGVLLHTSGLASAIAVFACYWPWRWGDSRDIVPVLLVGSVTPLFVLHWRGKWILTRWIGVADLMLYFGLFAWLFTRLLDVPIVMLLPAVAFVSSVLWAQEATTAGSPSSAGPSHANGLLSPRE